MVVGNSLAGMTTSDMPRRLSHRAAHPPYPIARQANGTATCHGNSEAITARAASPPSASNAMTRMYDGRHSRRQGADTLDQGLDFDIAGGFVAHEPVPEPIVLGFQKP